MCILFIANKQRQDTPFIMAANRDEFHARPTAPSAFWESHPDVLGGIDLEALGTWMGVTRNGKIAALTNIRAPQTTVSNALSRGGVVKAWLISSNVNHVEYAHSLSSSRHQYNGYNLVFGTINDLAVYNNHADRIDTINEGVYGLSNADIQTPWPKVSRGIAALSDYVCQADTIDNEALFDLLKNQEKATDDVLPTTGVPLEWERALSSIFIVMPTYGTRTSTIVTVDANNMLYWEERTFDTEGKTISSQSFHFSLHVE
jgi:uncharacterized protein with NRDE domain